MVPTSDLPISWMSPWTVASTTLPSIWRWLPRRFISGSSAATAAFMASPAMTSSGRKAIAAGEALAHLVDAHDKALVDRFQRVDPGGDGLLGQLG